MGSHLFLQLLVANVAAVSIEADMERVSSINYLYSCVQEWYTVSGPFCCEFDGGVGLVDFFYKATSFIKDTTSFITKLQG